MSWLVSPQPACVHCVRHISFSASIDSLPYGIFILDRPLSGSYPGRLLSRHPVSRQGDAFPFGYGYSTLPGPAGSSTCNSQSHIYTFTTSFAFSSYVEKLVEPRIYCLQPPALVYSRCFKIPKPRYPRTKSFQYNCDDGTYDGT